MNNDLNQVVSDMSNFLFGNCSYEQIFKSTDGSSLMKEGRQLDLSLAKFEKKAKKMLCASSVVHADEAEIKINAKSHWLHCVSNQFWTFFSFHADRGIDAFNDIGVLPKVKGLLCHDHWNPYFELNCEHAVCNADTLKRLDKAWKRDGQSWTKGMIFFLDELSNKITSARAMLGDYQIKKFRGQYRKLIKKGVIESVDPGELLRRCKGVEKEKTETRKLLDQLGRQETAVLKFIENDKVAFSNSLSKFDILMAKAHEKMYNCFNSIEQAIRSCRILSYLSTCKKQGVSLSDALKMLHKGVLPNFPC